MKERVRTSAVVVLNNKLLTFFAVDPKDGREFHFLPGGAIEPEETAPEAAERETLEETGFNVEVLPETCLDVEYDFHWNGETYHCLTFFYKANLVSPFANPKIVHDQAYNKGVVWVPLSEVSNVFSYSEAIKDAVLTLIEHED